MISEINTHIVFSKNITQLPFKPEEGKTGSPFILTHDFYFKGKLRKIQIKHRYNKANEFNGYIYILIPKETSKKYEKFYCGPIIGLSKLLLPGIYATSLEDLRKHKKKPKIVFDHFISHSINILGSLEKITQKENKIRAKSSVKNRYIHLKCIDGIRCPEKLNITNYRKAVEMSFKVEKDIFKKQLNEEEYKQYLRKYLKPLMRNLGNRYLIDLVDGHYKRLIRHENGYRDEKY